MKILLSLLEKHLFKALREPCQKVLWLFTEYMLYMIVTLNACKQDDVRDTNVQQI